MYIEQPQGFEVEDKRTHVCKPKKALYGFHQDPKSWYRRIDIIMTSLGFTKSKIDPNLQFNIMYDEHVILFLYVDDLFLTGNENQISECKKKLVV